tara:strand:+ start:180 stop:392 length:213 start_codon:yes stop_codon:yes gene_type:complete
VELVEAVVLKEMDLIPLVLVVKVEEVEVDTNRDKIQLLAVITMAAEVVETALQAVSTVQLVAASRVVLEP